MTTQNLDRLEKWIRAGLVLAAVALIFTIVRSSSAGASGERVEALTNEVRSR